MAYTLANLQTDIRSYTEVDNDSTKTPKVLTDSVLNTIIKNSEIKFIDLQIMMTIDFMQLQLYLRVIDT